MFRMEEDVAVKDITSKETPSFVRVEPGVLAGMTGNNNDRNNDVVDVDIKHTVK